MIVLMDWRAAAVRGGAALLFGFLALVWPGLTLTALVLLYGAFVVVHGVSTLAEVLTHAPGTAGRRGPLAFGGIVSVAAGIVTFLWPGITALVLLYIIAAWAVVTGAMEIAAAIELRRVLRREWLLVLGGVLSIAFGIVLVAAPGTGALAVTWLIGWYSVAYGALLVALAVRLRRWQLQARRQGQTARPVSA
ncbi:MAG TPA: DUF308 domain-containing protein [Acidimicrobiales bacterium]|nr:DUF308 domain-containing protein [Acidimicrobiales bacterium]